MNKRTLLIGTSASAALIFAAVAMAPTDARAWQEEVGTLRVATAASDEEARRRARYQPVIDYLEERLGIEVELVVTTEHAATAEAFLGGHVEVADLGTQAYAILHDTSPGLVRPFATQLNEEGGVGYTAVAIVKADSDYESFDDLAGKVAAHPSQSSNSGTVAPLYFLDQLGYDPRSHFGNTVFTGSHDNNVIAVVEGTADVGFIWWRSDENNAATSVMERGQVTRDDFRIIWESPVMPTNPWVVRTDLPQEAQEAIIAAIMEMPDKSPEALDSMSDGASPGFAEVDHETYLDTIMMRDFAMELRRN